MIFRPRFTMTFGHYLHVTIFFLYYLSSLVFWSSEMKIWIWWIYKKMSKGIFLIIISLSLTNTLFVCELNVPFMEQINKLLFFTFVLYCFTIYISCFFFQSWCYFSIWHMFSKTLWLCSFKFIYFYMILYLHNMWNFIMAFTMCWKVLYNLCYIHDVSLFFQNAIQSLFTLYIFYGIHLVEFRFSNMVDL